MSSISHIKQPIAKELEEFESHFRQSMKSNVVLLDKIMGYIVKRKGKQLRPMLVFLAAKLFGEVNEKTFVGASLIELLHTATLVHDDVVDEASFRRGFFSVNALWKNKIAVLVGDFLLSRGLILAMDTDNFDLLRIVTQAVKEMSEGELLQMEKARKLDVSEELYLLVIRQKTASLIASCCAVGAASVHVPSEKQQQLHQVGELIGMAFQIKDDLFDYGEPGIGKPVGIDIRERKATLPLIYALERAEKPERKKILQLISKHSEKRSTFKEVKAFVLKHNGIEIATEKMKHYAQQAKDLLNQHTENDARLALTSLIDYTIERNI